MKVIYVAGKYLGKCDWETYNNIHKARLAAHRLWGQRWAVICPHANTAFFGEEGEKDKDNPDSNYWKWLKGDLEIISRCDAIYMLNNYKESKGALIELKEAKKLGLEIIYEQYRR